MSSFLEIRNVVAKDIDINTVDRHSKCDHYYLLQMYFSQLVYFRWSFVEKSLKTLPSYVAHTTFDVDGTQAFFVEFEKTAFLSFRGTEQKTADWRIILQFWQARYKETQAHKGFGRALNKVKDRITPLLVAARVAGKTVHFTGHSMGGALATLMSIEHKPDSACVFGSPRLLPGKVYDRYFNSFDFTRIENKWDPITVIPPCIPFVLDYHHVGKAVIFPHTFNFVQNHFIKNYLRSSLDVYYAKSTGLDIDCYDPKELKKQGK